MKKFTPKSIMIVSALLIGLGAAGVAPTLYFHYSNRGTASAHSISPPAKTNTGADNKPAEDSPAPISGHPVSISVPDARITDLPIVDGYYDAKRQTWTLSRDKAQFAASTVQPNDQSGLTFIYGHYRKEVFATLHIIKPGAVATITTDNGYRFTYVLRETFAVAPTATDVLSYDQAPAVLAVQTCSGAWFQNRQMFIFDFKSVEKI